MRCGNGRCNEKSIQGNISIMENATIKRFRKIFYNYNVLTSPFKRRTTNGRLLNHRMKLMLILSTIL